MSSGDSLSCSFLFFSLSSILILPSDAFCYCEKKSAHLLKSLLQVLYGCDWQRHTHDELSADRFFLFSVGCMWKKGTPDPETETHITFIQFECLLVIGEDFVSEQKWKSVVDAFVGDWVHRKVQNNRHLVLLICHSWLRKWTMTYEIKFC